MKNVNVKINKNLHANNSNSFQIISVLVSVSFYCDHLSIYIVPVFKFF